MDRKRREQVVYVCDEIMKERLDKLPVNGHHHLSAKELNEWRNVIIESSFEAYGDLSKREKQYVKKHALNVIGIKVYLMQKDGYSGK